MKAGKGAAVLAVMMAGASALAGTNDFTVTGYASFDLSSGYVLYGALENDEPCYWTYGELSVGYRDWCSLGASLWQNTDMTTRRKETMRRMNEWDWSAFGRTGVDLADDWRLSLEAGHVWYVYHGIRPASREFYHTMEEWYGRVALENPFVTPYFEGFYDHQVYKGAFMQGGLKRTFDLPLGLTLTPDVTVGGGTRNYNACMYPPYDGSVGGGVTFVQAAATLAYWFNEHFGVHAKVAYAVLADNDIRHAVKEDGGPLENQFVWGTVGVDVAF